MPLVDSGTALFAGSAAEFVQMAPEGSLATHLAREFRQRHGAIGESEERSWRRSLTALAGVVAEADVDKAGVGVELKLPWNSKRIDASFVARDREGLPHTILVELKQWEEASQSPMPEMVRVAGVDRLHPSVQANAYADYLRESHSAFTEHGFRLSACAYLHNMHQLRSHLIRGTAYQGFIQSAPLFTAGDENQLSAFLTERVSGGEGLPLLEKLIHGGFSPSKKLLDHLARSLKEAPAWTLLDEQREAYNIVWGLAERAAASGEKAVVIVTGGPGTGKSVIAAHLLIRLSKTGKYKTVHATGSKAFTTNLRAVGGGGSDALFRYFNVFRHKVVAPNSVDVLICDEAHRVRETSNDRYTPREIRSDISQVRELIRAARVTVFFLDERQNVRPGEIGTVAAIEEGAAEEGVQVQRLALDTQFRCNGCAAYVSWVDALFTDKPERVGGWRGAEYELEVFDSPETMEDVVKARVAAGDNARLVAGFCWEWSDPHSDGDLESDVQIGFWKRPWNEKAPDQRKTAKGSSPTPKRHPYYLWATQPERLGEIGCIYSAQGFEFDYCGVILGDDLVWREGVGWVANRSASHDYQLRKKELSDHDLRSLFQQTYRVLLTRGMKGTFVFSTDYDTREKLKQLIGTASPPERRGNAIH
jgi:uncharacterized protein